MQRWEAQILVQHFVFLGLLLVFSAKKPTFLTEQSSFLFRADISTHALPRPPISSEKKFYVAHLKMFKT